ncbi:MAG: hypothetical protein A2Y64_00040 [Candidatus Coatesbacteria bacterium RBG_13_66_14]|uniref:Uncharacterized protein n=1 Tax=Candidatus Coatesbacteria bacterium RBG_13_66_14 TaxID=1817816 RepID=A0A1F5EYL0_9BACT|nr:MAG: hypothetical protein A2Y64_00040 [Candidatus Coatesbacteria bacterium RBG_13_66_14]
MRKAIIPAAILIIVAGLGCDLFSIPPGGDGDDQGEWQEPLTPRAVIEDIQWCYNNANGPFYSILLDADNFVFYFDPWDVQHEDLPISWLYDDEVEATQNLFDKVGAANIDLTLDFSESGDTEPGTYDTTFDIPNVRYSLLVTVTEEDIIYKAEAHANFTLSKFQDNTGLMRWWLTIWSDKVTW